MAAEPARIPTRTRVEPHPDVVTAKPPSVRNANVGGGQALLATLEAELVTLDAAETMNRHSSSPADAAGSWQYVLLALLGALLFAGGAAFSMMLG